ncbi:cation transporter [Rhodosalinus halophilus]|uniref:Cation transporter n=1 Tax=Rhodosalinus halophilus TaxID=2259333 RepID=A0A365UAC2_9RHOB|nr:cation diffusion facilitator family transporter [Rhodosalinus halophilus]RBI85691.1 cation transporter [Rhodosalinus halophilus]
MSGHGHHHHHHIDPAAGDARVALAVAANLGLTLAQIVAGVIAGSLALIADAIHNLSDALSLGIALAARRIGRRPADAAMTFGYGRAEVVAALINYTTLIVISVWLLAEGVMRLAAPEPVAGWIVVIVAGVALVVDVATVLLTWAMAKSSVNIRAAFLHNLSDAMASVGVIVSGSLILLYGWYWLDAAATLAIAGYILWQSAAGLKPVVRILMLASPEGIDPREVLDAMRAQQGVRDVHHLHIWRMQEHEGALEAHVVLDGDRPAQEVRLALRDMLEARFGLAHSTLQIETPETACPDDRAIGHRV